MAVSVASDGTGVEAGGADISADGHTAVFFSEAPRVTPATPLVPQPSLYVRDIDSGAVRLLRSFPASNAYFFYLMNPSLSADGSVVVIAVPNQHRDGTTRTRLLRIETATGSVRQVLPGPDGLGVQGFLTDVHISGDGSQVAFTSDDPGLVPGDTNATTDIFEASLTTGMVTLVSAAKDGTAGSGASSGPSISSDGRYVSFLSAASNLVRGVRSHGPNDVFRRDLITRTTQQVNTEGSRYPQDTTFGCEISADGQRVSYISAPRVSRKNHSIGSLYLRDLAVATPLLVAAAVDSQALSPDGRTLTYVVARSTTKSLGAFQVEIDTGLTKAAVLPYRAPNQVDQYQILAASTDGRFVLFSSRATNLTAHPGPGAPTLFRSDLSQF